MPSYVTREWNVFWNKLAVQFIVFMEVYFYTFLYVLNKLNLKNTKYMIKTSSLIVFYITKEKEMPFLYDVKYSAASQLQLLWHSSPGLAYVVLSQTIQILSNAICYICNRFKNAIFRLSIFSFPPLQSA